MPQKIVVPADRRLGFLPSITMPVFLWHADILDTYCWPRNRRRSPHLPRQLQPRTLMRALFVVNKASG
jgi:hypothetical protein